MFDMEECCWALLYTPLHHLICSMYFYRLQINWELKKKIYHFLPQRWIHEMRSFLWIFYIRMLCYCLNQTSGSTPASYVEVPRSYFSLKIGYLQGVSVGFLRGCTEMLASPKLYHSGQFSLGCRLRSYVTMNQSVWRLSSARMQIFVYVA
jgi:hypothetical protein